MRNDKSDGWSRREFIGGLALTGAAAMLGLRPGPAAAAVEPPPETTRLRIRKADPACWAPMYVAEPLLREEGFTDVQYVSGQSQDDTARMAREGAIDLAPSFSAVLMFSMEQQQPPLKIISGLHVGCYALVGSKPIHSVRDLKGKTVWAGAFKNSGPHIFFSTIVSYVGLDPRTDIQYAWVNKDEAMRQFREGKIDAFISFPPWPHELIEQGLGHLLIDTNIDKPWSQYFCCMVSGQSYFIKKNPIATKRALRAILKANDIVARNPELAARTVIEKKVWNASEYKPILRALKDIPYSKWRAYNPEDTVRFYALRMRDIGMIESNPSQFISQHTDWRFMNELKREFGITAW
jgi:NitT/TauT family transport system substrate-binding protein